MKMIQKCIMLSLMVLLTISTTFAQERSKVKLDPTAKAQKQTERMAKQLGLSAEQTAQVSKINLAYASKKVKGADKEAKKASRDLYKAEIAAVLTPEQTAKYEAMKKKKGGKKGSAKKSVKHKGETRAKKSPQEKAKQQTARMTEELGLSADQATKITSINTTYIEKKAAAKSKAGDDKDAFKAELKALKKDKKTAIEAVLTSDQLAKYKAAKKSAKAKSKGGKVKNKGKKGKSRN